MKFILEKKTLDAGAGESPHKKLFSKHKYVAIDAACGNSNWDYGNLDIICNLDKIPIANDEFDGIICTLVLEHVCQPQSVLNEFYRILKPGGLIYLSAPQGWGIHQAPHDYFRFTCMDCSIYSRQPDLKRVI